MTLLVIAALGPAAAERVVCPVAADTYVYATPFASERPDDSEAYDNHGGESQVVLKGREYFALLRFDLSAIQGMTVEKATLRIRVRSSSPYPSPLPLFVVGISTISGNGEWGEGAQSGGRARDDAANYFFARTATQPWAYAGSELSDVVFGLGGSLYAYLSARATEDNWQEIDVPPHLVHALTSGDQFGWLLSDEKGQTQARYSLDGRIQSGRAPSLIVEGSRVDQTAPGLVRPIPVETSPQQAAALGRARLRPGSVILRFGGAGDDVGEGVASRYELRYGREAIGESDFSAAKPVPRWQLDPLAPKGHPLDSANALRDEVMAVVEDLEPGELYYFASRAWDEAGNAGPVSPLGEYVAHAVSYPELPEVSVKPSQPARHAGTGIRVWAVPELVKIHPRTGDLLEQDYPGHREANPVWDGESGTVRLAGARNEFVGFQLGLESAEPVEGLQVTVVEPLFAGLSFPAVPGSAVQLYREWFVPDDQNTSPDRGWYADALLPLSGPLTLPARDNPVPGQTVQPLFADVYIPNDAAPGVHTGKLLVSGPDGFRREIVLEVEVFPFRLPDRLGFQVDLNVYSNVASGYPVRTGTPEYRDLEQAHHRLAQLHRTNLSILGYSQSGAVEPDHSPPLEGQGEHTRVSSWTSFDAHFGPLLDGSAFAGLPRAGVPIANMYLNFHENWPGPVSDYRWGNYPRPASTAEYRDMIARHGIEAGPIEEGFPAEWQDRFVAVVREFAAHFRERGWLDTNYQIYLNNKHFYKDPAQGGRGSSWWLLDEPNYRDDFRALSFFGFLSGRATADYPDVPLTFRTDISYADFMRDHLTDQVGLNCVSKRFFTRNRLLLDHRRRYGRRIWNYATTNHPRESNVTMRAWCWKVWLAGGDGLLPWNAIRGLEAWERAEPLTVFYNGSRFGKLEPFASLRLKAYRRGQQDAEYLALLAAEPGWDRDAVIQRIVLPTEAGDTVLETLRLRIARALESGREP